MNKLTDNFISIKFFDEEGLEKVSELTGMDFEELEYEQKEGNDLIGQSINGRYFCFCETDQPQEEITFNAFLRRCV